MLIEFAWIVLNTALNILLIVGIVAQGWLIIAAQEWTVNRMSEYIDRYEAIMAMRKTIWSKDEVHPTLDREEVEDVLFAIPSADVEPVVRCKDCVHQTKFWHNDGRMKNGGYYICGCDLVDGYSHVCLDDDFCSRGARMDGEQDG